MKGVDVIGIGAINLDFIYTSTKTDSKENWKKYDDGEEIFIKKHVFDEHLKKKYMSFLSQFIHKLVDQAY